MCEELFPWNQTLRCALEKGHEGPHTLIDLRVGFIAWQSLKELCRNLENRLTEEEIVEQSERSAHGR